MTQSQALYQQLMSTLSNASDIAKNLHEQVQIETEEDVWAGTEGLDVTRKLQEIWASFSTGNPMDKSYNEEIFK